MSGELYASSMNNRTWKSVAVISWYVAVGFEAVLWPIMNKLRCNFCTLSSADSLDFDNQ